MSTPNSLDGYEHWHQRLVELYFSKANASDPAEAQAFIEKILRYNTKIACTKANPTEKDRRISLERHWENIRKKNSSSRFDRDAFLSDLYSVCTVLGMSPNAVLLGEIFDEEDPQNLLKPLPKDSASFRKFLKQNQTISSFLQAFGISLSRFNIAVDKLPEDPLFRCAFLSDIVNRLSEAFSVEEPASFDVGKKKYKFKAQETIGYDDFCDIIDFCAHMGSNEEAKRIVATDFRRQNMFCGMRWTATKEQVKDSDQKKMVILWHELSSTSPKARFEMSINVQLLFCAISAIETVYAYNSVHKDGVKEQASLEMTQFTDYLQANPEIQDLVLSLFVGSFKAKNGTTYETISGESVSLQKEEEEPVELEFFPCDVQEDQAGVGLLDALQSAGNRANS